MSKLGIFAAFDAAVGAFMPPFTARSRLEAIRSFRDAVNTPDHQFHKHAADYSLLFLGEFDDANGSIVVPTAPERCVSGVECLNDDPIFPENRRQA